MRTITTNLLHRLAAQAQEAEVQGLSKVAESLTEQVERYGSNVRADDAFYSYNEGDFRQDVNSQLWSILVRAADFYGVRRFDAQEMQELVEKASQELVSDFCHKVGINHGVGAYEDKVPGEVVEKSAIEVDEEDV